MLTAVVFLPTPPLLIPQLAGRGATATQELRDACLRAVGPLAELRGAWTAIGTDDDGLQLGPTASGSWQPYGADVQVALGPDAAEPAELPLPALVAGWLRGCAAPTASIRMQLYRGDTTPEGCVALGHALADDPRPQALLVLGDGCTTLTEKAPGAYDGRAAAMQEQIDHALSTVDRSAVAGLDPQLCRELGVSGRVPWQIAAAAVGAGWHGESLHSSAPYGVGYQVAVWRR
ncbi:MAG: hypothetical protein M3Y19_08935 [Actinomycetota bacterium]|nr:hypothetical protein [Actinomycetota bacterium]